MGRNRVFRNTTTTDASRLTFYKKSIEQFKFARNKPVSKPTDNFTIDYATDEITRFQTYDQFRSLATGFYATRLGTDCSLNKTAPLSISDGKTGSISYQNLIEYHEDPFYTEAAQVFDIQMTIDACKYGKGTLYPYGEYEQKPTTNQFSFPTKVSVATCNSSLTYSDAIGAIGMRATRSAGDSTNVAIPSMVGDEYDRTDKTDAEVVDIERELLDIAEEDADDYDVPPSLSERISRTSRTRNLREVEPIENSSSSTANVYMYPRTTRFITFGQTGSSETNDATIPVKNAVETTAYALFPRHNKQSNIPDGFINVQGEIRPFRYRTPYADVRDKVVGSLGETICDIPDGRIVSRDRIDQTVTVSSINSVSRTLPKSVSVARGARVGVGAGAATSNNIGVSDPEVDMSLPISSTAKSASVSAVKPKITGTRVSPSLPATPSRATPMSTIINTKSRGCSKCRG